MFFKKRGGGHINLTTDIHSHILPGIDDGSHSEDESLELLRGLEKLGVKTCWFTPHIYEDRFPNTYDSISGAFVKLQQRAHEEGIGVGLEFAAEYYMGPKFISLLDTGEKLLTIKQKYLLVEFSMRQEPLFAFETIFSIVEKGYVPILAHPERYSYYDGKNDVFGKFKKHGCLLQMNLLSVTGYYGAQVKKTATSLLKGRLYDFAGSDMHNPGHLELLSHKNVAKVLREYDFRNGQLG